MSDQGIPLDPTCPLCTKPHGVEVSGDGYEHKCASCNAPITCAIGPDGGEMYPNIAPSVPDFEQPTMTCPRCKLEMPDYDGFGVLAHIAPLPNPCGYCTHPSADVVNGVSICGICGREVEGTTPAPAKAEPAPMRDTMNIVEIPGERGGTHIVHVLSCGHWLARRKHSKRLRCIGCAIERALAKEPSVTAAGPGPVALQAVIIAIEATIAELARGPGGDEARAAGLLAARPYLETLGAKHGDES